MKSERVVVFGLLLVMMFLGCMEAAPVNRPKFAASFPGSYYIDSLAPGWNLTLTNTSYYVSFTQNVSLMRGTVTNSASGPYVFTVLDLYAKNLTYTVTNSSSVIACSVSTSQHPYFDPLNEIKYTQYVKEIAFNGQKASLWSGKLPNTATVNIIVSLVNPSIPMYWNNEGPYGQKPEIVFANYQVGEAPAHTFDEPKNCKSTGH
eukprot:TRINITY_DN777_c0_g5_i1.p1 TRINITY_DN777_c0_g5~~TRINITY_DN777_c0_g5_i1.p1  ORF type:complete len:204 (-),score=50.66 TRINITY_DN777_c0_g5_i1:67-678(-)